MFETFTVKPAEHLIGIDEAEEASYRYYRSERTRVQAALAETLRAIEHELAVARGMQRVINETLERRH